MPRCEAIAATTGKRCRLMGSTADRMLDTPHVGSSIVCLCSIHAKKMEQEQPQPDQEEQGKQQEPKTKGAVRLIQRPQPVGTCSICLEDILPKQETEVDTCKHMFHRTCMVKWMEKNNITCPYCRHVMNEGEFMLTYAGRTSYARLPEQKKFMSKVHYLMGLLKQTMKDVHMNPTMAMDEPRMMSMFQMAALLNPLGSRMQSLVGFETLVYTFVASVTALPAMNSEESP